MPKKVLELGSHYVSDFLNEDESSSDRKKYSLDLYIDEEKAAVRLGNDGLAPPEAMWGRYWYRSGTNATMTKELGSIVDEIVGRVKLSPGDVWLDIACNDGTLLSQVPTGVVRIGIDPCDDTYYEQSSKHAKVVQTYFTKEAYNSAFPITPKKAKVITCIAMFYDLNDPAPFIKDMYECLDDDGVAVLQMSYTPLMMQQMAFDNICHEHVYYYSLTSLAYIFQNEGFRLVDASINDTNGGSVRVYFQKETAKVDSFATAPLRDVCNFRADSLLAFEQTGVNITNEKLWEEFGRRLLALKGEVVDFVKKAKSEGKTIYGYGASTKGNTLLQYFGLTNEDITAIAERSPYKFGKKTIGTEIPIVSEEEMREAKPDYLLVLPWHFIDEFVKREKDYLLNGGGLIVPCPSFKVITKDDL